MKKIFIIMTFCIGIGCTKQMEDEPITLPEITQFLYFTNSKIDTALVNQGIIIVPSSSGNNLVFKHFYKAADKIDFADDEFEREVFFEIPNSSADFMFENDLAKATNLHYRTRCFGCFGEYVLVENGRVSGEKIDSLTWQINIDALVENGGNIDTIRINEQFNRAN